MLERPCFITDLFIQYRSAFCPNLQYGIVTVIYPVQANGNCLLNPVRDKTFTARRRDLLLLRKLRGEHGKWESTVNIFTDWADAFLGKEKWRFDLPVNFHFHSKCQVFKKPVFHSAAQMLSVVI